MSNLKVQFTLGESTISACDTSGRKLAAGAYEIGKVAVAAMQVQILSPRNRKSDCGSNAGTISVDLWGGEIYPVPPRTSAFVD